MTRVTIAGVRKTAGRNTTAVSGVVETRCCASSPGSFLNIRLGPSLDSRLGRTEGPPECQFQRPRFMSGRLALLALAGPLGVGGLFDVDALAVGQVARGGF